MAIDGPDALADRATQLNAEEQIGATSLDRSPFIQALSTAACTSPMGALRSGPGVETAGVVQPGPNQRTGFTGLEAPVQAEPGQSAEEGASQAQTTTVPRGRR